MKILLVDEHAVLRHGLRRFLAEELPGAELGEAGDAEAALAALAREPWDAVVLDLDLPGRGGIDALKRIVAERPAAAVLVFTAQPEERYAIRALRAGAAGYLSKRSAPAEVVAALRKILSGGRYVTPTLAEALAANLSGPTRATPHEALSDRELVVLRRIAAGRTVKEIAYELALSEKTISTYRTRVLEKLALRTTADIIRYALDARLVD